jgi:hypothetical protein
MHWKHSFSKLVFELSVVTCIKANNQEELFKSFKRLVEEIYVKYSVSKICIKKAIIVFKLSIR